MADHLEYRTSLLFTREVHDWKLKSMTQLLDYIYARKIHHGEVNELEWIPSKTQGFQVKNYYKTSRREKGVGGIFLGKAIESCCTAKGVFFFSWCVS